MKPLLDGSVQISETNVVADAPLRCDVNNEYHLPLQLRQVECRPVWLFRLELIELGHVSVGVKSGGEGSCE